jgi:hypothetical protein
MKCLGMGGSWYDKPKARQENVLLLIFVNIQTNTVLPCNISCERGNPAGRELPHIRLNHGAAEMTDVPADWSF